MLDGLLLDGSADDYSNDAPASEPEPDTEPTDGPDLLAGTEGKDMIEAQGGDGTGWR